MASITTFKPRRANGRTIKTYKTATDNRPPPPERGYTHHWRTVRKWKLSRDPICEVCQRALATEVDHIKPIRQGGNLLDDTNLQSICRPCHARKTANDQKILANFPKKW